MPAWTSEQVQSLAPDPRAAAAAASLAVPWRWSELGRHEGLVWGRCQGTRPEPYRTMASVEGPAFACDCPSSKRPCKHSVALLLLLTREPDRFAEGEPPADVAEWRPGRVSKPVSVAREVAAPGPGVPRREERVTEGLQALLRWLEDATRQGLARLDAAACETMASRMVDAQAPGAARVLRQMGRLVGRGDWPGPVLERIGRLVLLCRAWPRLSELTQAQQADVRTAVGFTWSQEDLLAGSGELHPWKVVGQFTIDEERLRVQRTWLYDGERPALILGFSRFEDGIQRGNRLMPGTEVPVELVFFPGTVPLRALAKEPYAPQPLAGLGGRPLAQAVRYYQEALCRNPWIELSLLVLDAVVPLVVGGQAWVQDGTGRVPLHPEFDGTWQLLARSGGRPVQVAGEWDGEVLRPIAGVFDGDYRQF